MLSNLSSKLIILLSVTFHSSLSDKSCFNRVVLLTNISFQFIFSLRLRIPPTPAATPILVSAVAMPAARNLMCRFSLKYSSKVYPVVALTSLNKFLTCCVIFKIVNTIIVEKSLGEFALVRGVQALSARVASRIVQALQVQQIVAVSPLLLQ